MRWLYLSVLLGLIAFLLAQRYTGKIDRIERAKKLAEQEGVEPKDRDR